MTKTLINTVDEQEIAKFSAMANEWWDENGKFKPLHKFNPTRLTYIRDKALEHFGLEQKDKPANTLKGLKVLDIGCGGGLLCEPLTRLGAEVTGIDASEKNIKIAKIHSEKMGLKVNYKCTTAEDLLKSKQKYDIVLNMEVVEHVADVDGFLEASSKLVKPGGLMLVATLNRTLKSFAFAIVGAEYVLRWLPRGTHDWKKFLRPSEIEKTLSKNNMEIKEIKGSSYSPIRDMWQLSDDIDVNYMILATKPGK